MTKLLIVALVLGFVLAVFLKVSGDSAGAADGAKGPKIVHNVYFSLKEPSDEAVAKLVADCKKYLAPQPGVDYFAVGGLAKDLTREVNDRAWDVGLHVVFVDRAAHDRYQDDEQHHKFIAENKATWAKVRVFDTIGH